MSVRVKCATTAMDTLLSLPYFKGKGTLALGILRSCKTQLPINGKTRNGARLLLDLDTYHNANSMLPYLIGLYESEFLDVFLNCISEMPEGSAFVDVGANVGLYTCIAAREFQLHHQQHDIYAFEPNPIAQIQLEANIKVNSFTNIRCLEAGVSGKSGNFVLYINEDVNTVGSLRRVDEYLNRQITVPVITLDEFFASNHAKIGLMKVDIEGGEFDVFKGARNIISRDRPRLLFEVNAMFCSAWGHSPNDICDYLHEMHYMLEIIEHDNHGHGRLKPLASTNFNDGMTRNFLAIPMA